MLFSSTILFFISLIIVLESLFTNPNLKSLFNDAEFVFEFIFELELLSLLSSEVSSEYIFEDVLWFEIDTFDEEFEIISVVPFFFILLLVNIFVLFFKELY